MGEFIFIEADADGSIDVAKKAQVRSRCMQGINQKQDSRRSIRKANRAAKEKATQRVSVTTTAAADTGNSTAAATAAAATTRTRTTTAAGVIGADAERASNENGDDQIPIRCSMIRKTVAELTSMRKIHPERSPLDAHLLQFAGPVDRAQTPFLLHIFVIFDTVSPKESIYNAVNFSNFFYDRAQWLATDDLFFQSSLCVMSHMLDFSRGNEPSKLTLLHTHRTIRMLNRRLSSPPDACASEPVFWIVLALALASALREDYDAAAAHRDALGKIIELRGGLTTLSVMHPKIQHKLEALDTLIYLSNGDRRSLFSSPYWEPSFNHTLPPVQPPSADTQELLLALSPDEFDPSVIIAFRDLQHLTLLMNRYIEQDSLIDILTFQRALSAITSRLLTLIATPSVPSPSTTICLVLIAQITTLFAVPLHMLRLNFLTQKLRGSSSAALGFSLPLRLWVAVVCARAAVPPDEDWLQSLWDSVDEGGMRWDVAGRILRSVVWVPSIHEEIGRRTFEALQEVRRKRMGQYQKE